ncbi:MAG TPA: MazG family protein [Jiangellaceae bacterium]|nr:MazG family protein [Jiangellaceae bacterium]
MAAGRLVLLVISPRVAPGLLTAAAWEALRAGRVLVRDADHPSIAALRAAGIEPEPVGVLPPGALLDQAGGETLVWVGSPDGDPGLADGLAAEVAARAAPGRSSPVVEVMSGSYDLPGARLLDLVAVMDRLRSPGGCPWDREQTHRSLATYLLEETYETLESIETEPAHLREELGDLLLQIVFHARIAEEHETDPWSIDDVAAGIVEKLVRRHPHVFADADASTAAHVEARWDELKRSEKQRTSALDGIPAALPALAFAAKVIGRAHRAGVAPALEQDPSASIGDVLLGVVDRARTEGVDPEQALRDAVRRYAEQVRDFEARS